MKVSLQVLCLLVFGVVILTACGKNDTSDIERTSYDMSVRWGRAISWMGDSNLPSNMEIDRRISSTFQVSVVPELIPDGHDENNPPDIFETSLDPHVLLASDTIRTIPFDMISRYAPHYANLLMFVPFGLDAFKDSNTGNLVGLPLYRGTDFDLFAYSVYRLDWLEEHNVTLLGNITTLVDGRIYFTDTAFTQDQFLEIMRAFSEPPSHYGFAIMRRHEQLQNYRVLKGMWGLGNSIVNDNGKPNYYFADLRYPTGWFQAFMVDLMSPTGMISWLLELEPDARLLVAPPEVGFSGDSGVATRSASPFHPSFTWVVSAQVSDDELATILEIFDYVSFDHEAYLMVNFGFEGEHFEWEGAPFESRIIQSNDDVERAYENGAFIFSTGMHNPAGMVYRIGNNALTRHSTSEAGRRAIIFPYREDIYGEFATQYAELTERYGEELMRIRERFFLLAMGGQIDIEAEWQSYIDELNENGLQQFLTLVEQFPVVGR